MAGVAIAAAVIGAGTAVYGGIQANKQQKAAAAAANKAAGGFKTFDPKLLGDPNQIDLRKLLGLSIDANFDNLGYAGKFQSAANATDYGELMKYYKKIQPNFMKLQRQIGSNALSYAKGELPDDVISSIGRATAERGIQGGTGYGTQGARGGSLQNVMRRNLGLTSLDLSKYGTTLGMQVNQSARALLPNLQSVQQNLFTPAQSLQVGMQNNEWLNKFRAQDVAYINDARAAAVGAQNTANGAIADRNYASALNQASMTRETASQVGGLISQFGQYYQQQNPGWGGNSLATGTPGSATYNGQAVPRATLA